MRKKSVKNSTELVGTLEVSLGFVPRPKPQGPNDYREFLDYKAHAYWALCESREHESRQRQRQQKRVAKKDPSAARMIEAGVLSPEAAQKVVNSVEPTRGG